MKSMVSKKYPYPPYGGPQKFSGVAGYKSDTFPTGKGLDKDFLRGFQCY